MRPGLLLLLLTGCTSGTVTWGTGRDALRTALWSEGESAVGPRARVLLSTGTFGCALPAHDDPQEQWEALMALQAGACREDARHVVLTLYADDPSSWEGEFALVGNGGPDLDDDRVAEVLYVGIEEAAVVRSEGLDPTWEPTEVTWYWGSGDRGEVQIARQTGADVLSGHFDLAEAHVSGRFSAERCTGDDSLLDLLAASPTSACSVGAE